MFGYSIATGIKKGILPEEEFKKSCKKTWLTLTKYISDNGKINNVCAGTGQSDDVDYYLNRPKIKGDLHG